MRNLDPMSWHLRIFVEPIAQLHSSCCVSGNPCPHWTRRNQLFVCGSISLGHGLLRCLFSDGHGLSHRLLDLQIRAQEQTPVVHPSTNSTTPLQTTEQLRRWTKNVPRSNR
ncbi:hypothetical protein M440DRAFT_299960 [Trichoderma longibrachiatum ATCC 18648]|uniref:Uncharacterized protein n=1 Tax=Trichoderma longibrachiatum ATCC 18648 TaxID=983965 RepID=A0A2T4C530_TRILO|nr:hypothetical protein M440DRAFT_299960 [Trichoderma longibrachiatum ATCC 18648]